MIEYNEHLLGGRNLGFFVEDLFWQDPDDPFGIDGPHC